jgi:hypothetical protein
MEMASDETELQPTVATHSPPRDADFVIHADLASDGMPGRMEQLWVSRTGPRTFLVRSLPFFVYGVALDDEVETTDDLVVRKVVKRSGRRLLRVASTVAAAQSVHDELHPMLERLGYAHEWRGVGYVSIDVGPDVDPSDLVRFLDDQARSGCLFYEYA